MRTWRAAVLALGLALGSGVPDVALAEGPSITAAPLDPVVEQGVQVDVPVHWETVVGERVRVHAPARHRKLMQVLADHADGSLPILSQRLRMSAGGPIDIFLSTTDAQFRQVQPGEPPTWADATAYPELGAVFLRAPGARNDQEPLTQVLDHELVHILVGRTFAPERPPTWLQEGLAQLHAESHDLEDLRTLASASISGPIPLDDLERAFPDNPHQASLAYAQSVDFLVWLERAHGTESVHTLVRGLAAGAPLHEAVKAATGEPLYRIDQRWRDRFSITSPIAWARLAGWDLMWLISALIGIVAMFTVRRRQRRRRDEIAAQEREEEALVQSLWEQRYGVR